MRGGAVIELNGDIEAVAGDKTARGGDDGGVWRLAGFRPREQHPQRIALIQVNKASGPVAPGKADFGNAMDRGW